MSLDEINRALDLARERDPSLEPEPGYSDGFQSEPQLSAGNHATNLSILAAAAFVMGHRSREAVRVAKELYSEIQQLVRECSCPREHQAIYASLLGRKDQMFDTEEDGK